MHLSVQPFLLSGTSRTGAPLMPRTLSQSQIDAFRLNGHLTVDDLLTADEVATLSAHCDLIAAGKADHIPDTSIQLEAVFREGEREVDNQVLAVRKLSNVAVYDDTMWSHVTNPKIVDVIADLLDTDDIKLYGDQLFMKAPKTGTAKGWQSGFSFVAGHLPHGSRQRLDGHRRRVVGERVPQLRARDAPLGHDQRRQGGALRQGHRIRWMARGPCAAGCRRRQLSPQPAPPSEQRQPLRKTAARLLYALHARHVHEG